MTLTKYAWKQWLPICLIGLFLTGITGYFAISRPNFGIFHFIPFAILLITLALLSFYRSPRRLIPKKLAKGTMLSPADGIVSVIEFQDYHEAVRGKAVLIRIFLSVLNVHINRMPCDCRVQDIRYVKGKFLDARLEESAKVNESNLIILEYGTHSIGLRQVSGKLAKRIICKAKIDEFHKQGDQFGMITLGSTTELILPDIDDVSLLVEQGQYVRGGLTPLAKVGN